MKGKVLILGAFGMLGHDLQRVFPGAVIRGHEVDVTDAPAIRTLIRDERPSLVINAAAITNVDYCENHPEIACLVNGESLEHLAAECQKTGAILIYYSSDYVFPGRRDGYRESDSPHPLNSYGVSKLLGELNTQEHMDDYRIIRTSWLFGKHGENLVNLVLERKQSNASIRVINDRYGKPTYTLDLARKTAEIAGMVPGIYHATNEGICSWFDLAKVIYDHVIPMSKSEDRRPAQRPDYSVLINTKTSSMRHWKEALNAYIHTIEGE